MANGCQVKKEVQKLCSGILENYTFINPHLLGMTVDWCWVWL